MDRKPTISILFALPIVLSFIAAGPLWGDEQPWEWGAKAGIALANLERDDISGSSMKPGITGGGFVAYGLTDRIALQAEVLFSFKGAQYQYERFHLNADGGPLVEQETLSEEMRLSYFEFPILVTYSLPTLRIVEPRLMFGPALSFTYEATYSAEYSGWASGSHVRHIEDKTRVYDVGLVFGLSLGVHVGKGTYLVEGRYTLGLTSPVPKTTSIDALGGLYEAAENSVPESEYLERLFNGPYGVKNNVISIMIGYGFH